MPPISTPPMCPAPFYPSTTWGRRGDPAEEFSRWKWAGETWQDFVRIDVTKALTAVEIQAENPDAVARRWAEVLDIPLHDAGGTPTIKLDNATIRFVADVDGRGLGIGAIDILPADRDAIVKAAEQRGLRQSDGGIVLCGVRINLV